MPTIKTLASYIIPIRKTQCKTEVLLNHNLGQLSCIKETFYEAELVDAVIDEIENEVYSSLYQYVYINEVAYKFNATALCCDFCYIKKDDNQICIYFLATLNDAKNKNYAWIEVDNLTDKTCKDADIIKDLCSRNVNLSYYANEQCFDNSDVPVIAFDCGGVLIEWEDKRLFKEFAKIFSCTVDEFNNLFMVQMQRYALHVGNKSHFEVFKYIEEKTHKASFLKFINAYYSNERVIEENVLALKKLKEIYPDLRFIIASNTNSITEKKIIDYPFVKDYINHGFFSWRIKATKPTKNFYDKVYDIIKTTNVFFIDDSLDNLNAATLAGWTAYYSPLNSNLLFNELQSAVKKWLNNFYDRRK